MIQSAMMFALGVFVSGLISLAFLVALVRRTRRITERRLLAGIATRRAEFNTERDELRARHAVQMHQLEREVSRVLDQATAYRLESDIKERDLVSARAEVEARDEELQEFQLRLTEDRELLQDVERRHAEAGSALRAAQHGLKLEAKRRAMAEAALDEAAILTDQRRLEVSALRAENETFRVLVAELQPDAPILQTDPPKSTPEPLRRAARDVSAPEAGAEAPAEVVAAGGSVVPLPTRPRPAAIGPAATSDGADQGVQDPQNLVGEAHADLGRGIWRAPAAQESRPRSSAKSGDETGAPDDDDSGGADPENRFIEALAEIRALKRAASQAGE